MNETTSDQVHREYMTVEVGEQLFGLPIEGVHDVFRPENMTSVPQSTPEIAGVLNMRGRIVTSIDMRRRLDLPPRKADETAMAVGIEANGESYGLIIDRVGEVLRLPTAGLEANPVNMDRGWAELSQGVYRLDERLMIVLDVKRVLVVLDDLAA